MAITAVCSACRAVYNLSDQQQGKKVRCKHCDAVFVVTQAPARKTPTEQVVARPVARERPPAVTARRTAPMRVARDQEEEESESQPKQGGKSALPWILGGCGALAALFLVGGIILAVVLMRSDKSSPPVAKTTVPQTPVIAPPPQFQPQPFRQPANPPVNRPGPNRPPLGTRPAQPPIEGQPVAQPVNPPPVEAKRPPATTEDAPPKAASGGNSTLTAEGRKKVKRATVYLRVTMGDGSRASGTGFFGSVDARNIILTNAHVVGMLAPESRRPRAIEVFINSGEADELKTTARVLGVDQSSDLAVLDIGIPPKTTPEPLTVKSASGLQELDTVYVFGFPLGEALGKEITIRPSSVSSLRKKGGVLDRVQVNGGMDPGNSGGPVVDNSGQVVGVAVSGIPGRQINFAIPGERVHTILNGRISNLIFHQPYLVDGKTAVPTVTKMIDPRNLIKEVSLEVWSGDKPVNPKAARRPSATAQPAPQPGDSPHLVYALEYRQGEGRKDIILPDLPPGKVYWQQPRWVDAKGVAHWASAALLRLPSQAVERKPAALALKYPQGANRPIALDITNSFKVGNEDDTDTFRIQTKAEFQESVLSAGANGSSLRLQYLKVKRDVTDPSGKTHPSELLAQIKGMLGQLKTRLQIDPLGNISRQFFEPVRGRMTRAQFEQLKGFHEVIQQGLEVMSVPMPQNGTVNPLESWKAERHLPIDTPGKFESGKLDMTYTYLGVRNRNGRDEAVINIDGVARGERASVGGKATGTVLVDLATGQTLLANITVVLDLDMVVNGVGKGPQKIKFIATTNVRLQRKL